MNALAPTLWTGTVAEPRPHRWTLDEVVRLRGVGVIGEDARVELLDGEIIDMPPEGELHAWFKLELSNALFGVMGRDLRLAVETRLAFAEKDAPVPDLHVMPRGLALTDTPGGEVLLLVEVADTTLSHDMGRKAAKYAANGVTEYWVVNLRARRTVVHLRPEDGAYLERRPVAFDEPLAPTRIDALQLVIAALPGYDKLSFDPPPA